MYPLLRAAIFGLLISLALVHTIELFGPLQVFMIEDSPLERVRQITGTSAVFRFWMVASVFVALSALFIPPGFFIRRGTGAPDAGGAALFISLAAALLASVLLAQVMTVFKAVLPLASAALKSGEFSLFDGEPGRLPVSIEQALLSVGRGAVYQEFNRYDALFTRQTLVYLPITEALFGMASLVFFARIRPGRAIELCFLGGAALLMLGAGLALYLLENDALTSASVSLSVVASRLGFILLAGGLLLGLSALRRMGPDGVVR